jgi:AcrR family transcriptional regulator
MSLGRPRNFEPDAALAAALQVFWRKGYTATSLGDLTRAMGINRPSLYAAFGNKEELFRKALERYTAGPAAYVRDALHAPTAYAVAERLLQGAARLLTDPHNPGGCLIVHGALTCSAAADPIRRELIHLRRRLEQSVARRLRRARTLGDLPVDANPADLARLLVAQIYGMAVLAVSGSTRNQLLRITHLALMTWPK